MGQLRDQEPITFYTNYSMVIGKKRGFELIVERKVKR